MKGQDLRKALRSGQRVYGTLIVANSPRWPADAVAHLGLDFVFIDSEHVPLDRGQLSWMCRTYAAMGIAPIVRIPSPDPYWATMVVDGGAQGVIAPYLERPEQARQVGSAIKLRPLRGQRLERAASGRSRSRPSCSNTPRRAMPGSALSLISRASPPCRPWMTFWKRNSWTRSWSARTTSRPVWAFPSSTTTRFYRRGG